jgi:hypothetical protein
MKSAILIFSMLIIGSSAVLEFLQPAQFDGVQRVRYLTNEAALQTELANPLVVVLSCNDVCDLDKLGEPLAQTLSARLNPIPVFRVSVAAGQPNQIHVYRDGKKFLYHGRRDVDTFVRFLKSFETPETKTITGKLDKIAFDQVRGIKLVGYFVTGTPEHQVFEQASSLFSPIVHFYIVSDVLVAKHLKLNTTGQINLYRDYEKHPVTCGANPATLADIQKLIVLNRDQALVQVNEFNMFDPALDNPNVNQVFLMTDTSPMSLYLKKMITKALRNITTTSRILWMDTSSLPNLAEISTTKPIHGLTSLPGLGFYDGTTKTVTWMDLSQISSNLTTKAIEQTNLELMKIFLQQSVATSSASGQSFTEEPVDITVDEGAQLTLKCVVANKVGDCLWSKDDVSIGYTLSQFPHIHWVDPSQTSGECSIQFSTVKSEDQAIWKCSVSGTSAATSLVSTPAQIVVTPADLSTKTEL